MWSQCSFSRRGVVWWWQGAKRTSHKEAVAVVKLWKDVGSNKSLGCVFCEKPAYWTSAFKLEISSYIYYDNTWLMIQQKWGIICISVWDVLQAFDIGWGGRFWWGGHLGITAFFWQTQWSNNPCRMSLGSCLQFHCNILLCWNTCMAQQNLQKWSPSTSSIWTMR